MQRLQRLDKIVCKELVLSDDFLAQHGRSRKRENVLRVQVATQIARAYGTKLRRLSAYYKLDHATFTNSSRRVEGYIDVNDKLTVDLLERVCAAGGFSFTRVKSYRHDRRK